MKREFTTVIGSRQPRKIISDEYQPNTSQYKWYAPNTWYLSRSLCWWHLCICNWPQRGLRSQKAAARSHCYWHVVCALEHKNQWRLRQFNFLIKSRFNRVHLTLNGRNIPFVNHVKYLAVIFDKMTTWRLHTEMTEAKAFRTFIRINSLFQKWRFSDNINIIPH
jgi:hypothetical protein